jgi:hypothetical protein
MIPAKMAGIMESRPQAGVAIHCSIPAKSAASRRTRQTLDCHGGCAASQ